MIKIRLKGTTGPMILLGLSEANLQHLKAGEPIVFSLAEVGLGTGQLAILYGTTEAEIVEDLKRQGVPLP